jgi:hypothetical protein
MGLGHLQQWQQRRLREHTTTASAFGPQLQMCNSGWRLHGTDSTRQTGQTGLQPVQAAVEQQRDGQEQQPRAGQLTQPAVTTRMPVMKQQQQPVGGQRQSQRQSQQQPPVLQQQQLMTKQRQQDVREQQRRPKQLKVKRLTSDGAWLRQPFMHLKKPQTQGPQEGPKGWIDHDALEEFEDMADTFGGERRTKWRMDIDGSLTSHEYHGHTTRNLLKANGFRTGDDWPD